MALTNNDYRMIVGMVGRGDKHHDVAAWFGENQARVAEVIAGNYGNFEAAPSNDLPPKGAPGIKGRRLQAFVKKALAALEAGDAGEAKSQLEAGLKRFDLHE